MHVCVTMQDRSGASDTPQFHHAYESPSEEEERLGALFNQLDTNGDGRIDARDLSEGLKRLSLPQVPGGAEVGTRATRNRGLQGENTGTRVLLGAGDHEGQGTMEGQVDTSGRGTLTRD